MIDSAAGTIPGDTMTLQEGGWGEAASIPPTVDDLICGEPLEGTGPQSVVTDKNLVDISSPAGDEEAIAWAQKILDDSGVQESKPASIPQPNGQTNPARRRRRSRRGSADEVAKE